MKYDFILFESFYTSVNHYKDLSIIAKLLADSGYRVAIADVLQESIYCKDFDLTHIQLNHRCNATLTQSKHNNIIIRFIINAINRILVDFHFIRTIRNLKKQSRNIYCGTINIDIPLLWLLFLGRKNKYFFWGVRSHYLNPQKHTGLKLSSLKVFLLSYLIKSHDNLALFVSDDVIKQEFLALGYTQDRLILRPERYAASIVEKSCNTNITTILSIGTLRPQKHIEFCMRTILNSNIKNIKYVIAGKSSDQNMEQRMKEMLAYDDPRIVRIDKRLSEEEYNELMANCDYLLLCDSKQLSSITNGTMYEALFNGVPIIAPDHEPYKSLVEEKKVGLLYTLDDENSLSKTIDEAAHIHYDYFKDKIVELQKESLYENILKEFKRKISVTIA